MLTFRRASPLRIDAERLILRLPEMGDHLAWSALRRRGADYLRLGAELVGRPFLRRRAFRNRVYWAYRARGGGRALALFLFRREDAQLVGAMTLDSIRRGPSQSAQVGYWTGQEFARRGYMAEALVAVVDHAFGILDLSRVEAAYTPRTPLRADCWSGRASSTRGWRSAICRSTAAGGIMCSMRACAPIGGGRN